MVQTKVTYEIFQLTSFQLRQPLKPSTINSDDYLVFAVLNLRMPKPPAAYVVARSYKHYDPQSFLSDLNKIPWYENILSDDLNEKLLHFNRAFFRVLDNRAPIKKIKIKHGNVHL